MKTISMMVHDLANKQHIARADVREIIKAVAKDSFLSYEEMGDLSEISAELEKKMTDGARRDLLTLLSLPSDFGYRAIPTLGKKGIAGGYVRGKDGIGHVVFGQMKNGKRDGLWSSIDMRREQTYTFYKDGKPEPVSVEQIRENADGNGAQVFKVSHDIVDGAGNTSSVVFAYVIAGYDSAPTKTIRYEDALAKQLQGEEARMTLLGAGATVNSVYYNGEFDCIAIEWTNAQGVDELTMKPADDFIQVLGDPDVF